MVKDNGGMIKFFLTFSITILIFCAIDYPFVEKGSAQYVVLVLSIVVNLLLSSIIILILYIKKRRSCKD